MNPSDRSSSRFSKRHRETCPKCGAAITITCSSALEAHQASQSCQIVNCNICHMSYPFLNHIEHGTTHARESRHIGAAWGSTAEDSFVVPDFVIEEDYRELYVRHEKYIKPSRSMKALSAVYNFQLHRLSVEDIKEHLLSVFRDQKTAFKLKISLAFILKNNEDQSLHFYYSSQNNQLLFSDPHFVGNLNDLSTLTHKIDELDLVNHVTYPCSKFSFIRITNVTFFLSKVLRCPIGSATEFPPYLKNTQGLISLVSNKRGKPYTDNLCFFRCLALFQGAKVTALEKKTKELFEQYIRDMRLVVSEFEGVSLNDLEDASRIFEMGVFVYAQNESGVTEHVFRSLREDNIMYLNLYKKHFSFIKDLCKFSRSFRCTHCSKLFPSSYRQRRHTATCDAATRDIYTGGSFEPNRTIFDQLEDFDIEIPAELRYFPYRMCFDIECALVRDTGVENSTRVEFSAKHLLASISVCSNVPGYLQPQCLITNGCERELVKRFIALVTEISGESHQLMKERFSDYLTSVDQTDDEKLVDRFEEYLQQLPLLSFCGQRYDIPTIKTQLFSVLLEAEDIKYVIKKGSAYSAISTENFLFLDVSNYLAAGTSYDQFLKAYGASVHKSYFPYEYFDSLEKLSSTTFPSYESFFSSLKGRNTLEPTPGEVLIEEEQQVANQYPRSEDSTLLSPDQVVGVGIYRYEKLRLLFQEEGWTFADFLAYYNNRDVEPFLQAIENQTQYYEERGVDIFKQAISVPGVSLRLAFKDVKESFHLFSKRHSDLVKLFLSQNVGGPALIFDRFQEAGVTTVGHDAHNPVTRKILGLDANALYLWCTAQEMASGLYIRRRAADNFRKEYPSPISMVATEWLADVEHRENISIQHVRNTGEYRIGARRLAVDGYHRETNTVYQFQGCYFHGCPSCKKENRDVKVSGRTLNEKFKKTKEISDYIRKLGYTLVEMWECSWTQYKTGHEIHNRYVYTTEHLFRMTKDRILEEILNGHLFGAVQCDLRVPDHLKAHYAEMPPIFKNTTVTADDIGEHMTEFLRSTGKSFKPTRYLIGSMFAEKILIITPLLIWYVQHGLEVTDIHQVIEFAPSRCFKSFADNVSEDRRAGDQDPALRVVAETSKLIGNSFYGYTIMNKSKHVKVDVVDQETAADLINGPRFSALDELSDNCYEVTSRKKSIRHNLPIQIGFFVYSYAKLRMLSFYFDVLVSYIPRPYFSLCEMDTDSLYMALAADTLDELIKPELRQDWTQIKLQWFPRTDTEEHAAYDRRTPGLFKVEWSGGGFVGLSAKTYFCFEPDAKQKEKCSTKGINKAAQVTIEHFRSVLQTKQSVSSTNRGFIVKNNTMLSYRMERKGLSYFYCKRKILDDGISTTFLDI
ncbi:uncharacterized protein LOC134820563 [Bolinopsis microptera]|uniref:uncharacterized protein LOC134820563 n=1 Tax=Bolinopsis microptera TaxID=2820187 RepID=UPI00307A09F6